MFGNLAQYRLEIWRNIVWKFGFGNHMVCEQKWSFLVPFVLPINIDIGQINPGSVLGIKLAFTLL